MATRISGSSKEDKVVTEGADSHNRTLPLQGPKMHSENPRTTYGDDHCPTRSQFGAVNFN